MAVRVADPARCDGSLSSAGAHIRFSTLQGLRAATLLAASPRYDTLRLRTADLRLGTRHRLIEHYLEAMWGGTSVIIPPRCIHYSALEWWSRH